MVENESIACGKIEVVGEDNLYSSVRCVKAIPYTGYSFFAWTGDTSDIEASNSNIPAEYCTQISVLFNDSTYKKVYANFIQNPTSTYSVIANAASYGNCEVVSSIYPWQKTIVAKPSNGYRFDFWEGPATYVNDENKAINPLWVSLDASQPTATFIAHFTDDIDSTKIWYKQDNDVYLSCIDISGQIGVDDIPYNVNASIVSVVLGTTISAIGDKCFYDIAGLSSVEPQSNISSIGIRAFESTSLSGFDFSKLVVKQIPSRAFHSTSIKSIFELYDGVSTIGEKAFSECLQLTGVSLPSSIIEIGDYAFDGCNRLISVDMTRFSGKLPSIFSHTFGDVDDLPDEFTIYMKSTNESRLAFDNENWNHLYKHVQPQIDFNPFTILKFNLAANDTAMIKGWPVRYGVECIANSRQEWDDGSYITSTSKQMIAQPQDEDANQQKYVIWKYRNNKDSPCILSVQISNTLSSFSCENEPCIDVELIGSNVVNLPEKAFANTLLNNITFSKSLQHVGAGCLAGTNIRPSSISVENGIVLHDSWVVLNNGSCSNVYMSTNASQFNANSSSVPVQSLEPQCFTACSSLALISLPASLSAICLPCSIPQAIKGLVIEINSGNQHFKVTKSAANVYKLMSMNGETLYLTGLPESTSYVGPPEDNTDAIGDVDDDIDIGTMDNYDTSIGTVENTEVDLDELGKTYDEWSQEQHNWNDQPNVDPPNDED